MHVCVCVYKMGITLYVHNGFLNKLSFEIILDLQKACQGGRVSMPLTQGPLMLTSYMAMLHLSELGNQDILLTELLTLFGFY